MPGEVAPTPPGPDGVDEAELERSRGRRRALQRAIIAIFAAAAIALMLGAWPFVEAAIDAPRVAAAKPGVARVVRARGWAVGPGPTPDDDRLSAPGRERLPSKLFDTLLENEGDRHVGRMAISRGAFALRESASLQADPKVTIEPNARLFVLRDSGGDWLQLAFRQDGQTVIGWTTREHVILLP